MIRCFLNSFCLLNFQVGSGKTSLLNSLLGEMRCVHGSILLNGSVAYVPQVPWLLSGTVRENILFGKPFDSKRFSKFASSTLKVMI
jgi:ATP-binding cassette subfamily C (CFTR/MRP) protein 10